MFATLLGALPRPDASDSPDGTLGEVLRAQAAAGLAPLTDGRLDDPPAASFTADLRRGETSGIVDRWRCTQELAGDAPVKQALPGPWSLAVGAAGADDAHARELAIELGKALHEAVIALAGAGCPLVEIEETEAHDIGGDTATRAAFRGAHLALAGGVTGTHLSLSLVGGSAWDAGAATILDPPYHSLAVDLIDGPDNWRLVADVPADRGVIVGALATRPAIPDGNDVLLYALGYAASTNGRGPARVGLGTAGGLAHLPWDRAVERMGRLGEAVRVASLSGDERAAALDPRAVNARSAALGRFESGSARSNRGRRSGR